MDKSQDPCPRGGRGGCACPEPKGSCHGPSIPCDVSSPGILAGSSVSLLLEHWEAPGLLQPRSSGTDHCKGQPKSMWRIPPFPRGQGRKVGRACGALQRIRHRQRAVGGRGNGQEKADPGFTPWWNPLRFPRTGRAESRQEGSGCGEKCPLELLGSGSEENRVRKCPCPRGSPNPPPMSVPHVAVTLQSPPGSKMAWETQAEGGEC